MGNIQNTLKNLSNMSPIPESHILYLKKLKEEFNFKPEVIYDIGACVLHWTNESLKIWPNSTYYLFEGMDSVGFLYDEIGFEYHLGVLSDVDNKELIFYQSNVSPGGNSYYKEDSWATELHYGKDSERIVKTITVDTVVKEKKFKLPDLVKIDVQGCEVDILKGMTETLKTCKHLIVELQHSQYNVGAPLNVESISFIESLGFELVTGLFTNNGPDGDYHFIKKTNI
jgi:FkbM family methyltransferase